MKTRIAGRKGPFLALAAGLLFSGLIQAQVETFTIPLEGSQEVPPVVTGGTGSATVTLNTSTGAVSVTGSYTGLNGNQTVAHIHGAAPAGANAGVVLGLTGTGGTTGTISGSGTLNAGQIADMLAGRHYINVHSVPHGGGELRGQICQNAAVTTRNAGTNPVSYTAAPLVFGGSFTASVDLTTTGHNFAILLGFDTPIDVPLGGGQRLLCVDFGGSGELFTGAGLGPVAGPTANFSLPLPSDLAFCNFNFCSQALHFGGPVPFALSNAQDLTLGF